nr:pyruvate formate lyase family protein [Candidatus Sigynarchaeota archaeon]
MIPRLAALKAQVDQRTRAPDGTYRSSNVDSVLIQIGYNEAASDPEPIRWAQGYVTFFEESDVDILPGEILVGTYRQGSIPLKGGIYRKDTAITGHLAVDYDLMLKEGLDGTLQRIESARSCHASTGTATEAFYTACRIVLKGFQAYILRYEAVARTQASQDGVSPGRKADLERLQAVLRRIAHDPPNIYHEAVQLVLLYHMVIQLTVGLCSFGRPDRYLYPCFARSLRAGESIDDIKEITGAWFIKTTEFYAVPQSLMLGGQDAAGNCVANDLTALMLDVIRDIGTLNPGFGFSWNEKTPDTFMFQILENWKAGVTHPAVFNDTVIVPAMERMGIAHEHVIHFTHCTCTEITPEGYSNIFVVGDYINVNKCLLKVINGYANEGPFDFADFAEFLVAFKEEFLAAIEGTIKNQIRQQEIRRDTWATPLVSIYVHDCIERGIDMAQGGARYNYTYTQLVGLPTLADSLYAVKTLVYDRKAISLKDLSTALRSNWKGFEALRMHIMNKFPKWGNDIADVDALGIEVVHFYFDTVKIFKGIHQNGAFYPGFLCFIMHDVFGRETGATPDGRLAGKALSSSIGPVAGQGKAGLTATCNSAAKIDHIKIGGASSVLNLTVLKSNVDTPASAQAFIDLI